MKFTTSCDTDRYFVGMLSPNSLSLCSPHLQGYSALVLAAHLEKQQAENMKSVTIALFTEQTKEREHRLTSPTSASNRHSDIDHLESTSLFTSRWMRCKMQPLWFLLLFNNEDTIRCSFYTGLVSKQNNVIILWKDFRCNFPLTWMLN